MPRQPPFRVVGRAAVYSPVFELSVETTFAAAHAIDIAGQREPLHGHNWHVTVTLQGGDLDADGLLVDFHAVEEILQRIVKPFHNRNLNELPPFNRVNPTAEHVARHIGEEMVGALTRFGDRIQFARVRLTEAPGCAVTWWRPRPPHLGAPTDPADG